MSTSDELRRILTIISDLTNNDINSSIKDTKIITEANRQYEVEKYLITISRFNKGRQFQDYWCRL